MQFPNYADLSLSDSLQRVIEESDVSLLVDTRSYDEYDELDEISLYADLDPVLADLLKQYKTADKQSLYLDETFSKDDPMAEIASDRKESAWSAVETRMIELREDEKFSGMVGLRLMRLEEERAGLIPEKEISEERKAMQEFIVRDKKDNQMEQREEENKETDFLMFFLWMWVTKRWAEKSQRAELQNSFMLAA